MIISFPLCLLINGCENIYSRNNNVCLGFHVMDFLCGLLLCDGFLCRLLLCDGFLYGLLLLKLVVNIKRGYVAVFMQIVAFKTYC